MDSSVLSLIDKVKWPPDSFYRKLKLSTRELPHTSQLSKTQVALNSTYSRFLYSKFKNIKLRALP